MYKINLTIFISLRERFISFAERIFITIFSIVVSIIDPQRDVIILESEPGFSGNPRALFDQLIEKGYNKKYRFIWFVRNPKLFKSIKIFNVHFLCRTSSPVNLIRSIYLQCKAKFIFDSNYYVQKINSKTIRIFLQHGQPLKFISSYTQRIGPANYIVNYSNKFDFIYTKYCGFKTNQMLNFGAPANDSLFNQKNLYENGFLNSIGIKDFDGKKFNKIIGWFPTYRKQKKSNVGYLSQHKFPLPILNSVKELNQLNDILMKNNCLMLIRFHHAALLPDNIAMLYSHIVLLDNEETLIQCDMTFTDLLASLDCLITDYSSCYYEFLLTDNPIGLAIDDFEEYSRHTKFAFNYFDVVKGAYMRTFEDLTSFINDIAHDIDHHKNDRIAIKKKLFMYYDNHATDRLVNFLEEMCNL